MNDQSSETNLPLQVQRHERVSRIEAALKQENLAAVICSHQLNVLMLTGYWPVIGTAVAIVTAEPRVILLVPKDEEELAKAGWADEIHTFQPASLQTLENAPDALSATLKKVLPSLGQQHQRIGYEAGSVHLPVSYVSLYAYGNRLPAVWQDTLPSVRMVPGDDLLQALRMRLTHWELERLRCACSIAMEAYEEGAAKLRSGISECEAVLPFYQALLANAQRHGVKRADGFLYCMSGPNSAQAYAAYQRTRDRQLQHGDLVLVHCNSYVDGYWTDLTRTYILGEADAKVRHLYACITEARQAAFAVISPGVKAADVDRAARDVIVKCGYGDAFKHATGHGVGFSAIDHAERPRIHPCSTDILEPGMVFNVEPGIYLENYGGIRDCNLVAVTDNGYGLLSPFQLDGDMQCHL
jgi:Xaa-Pro aminopeptidase